MKVIQISDTHLFANDDLDMFGVKTNLKFKEVIAKVIQEDSHDADLIFITGDISQDETVESYQKARNYLSQLNIPIYWIPGNHDNIIQAEKIFQDAKDFNRNIRLSLSDWHFIFLNTKLEGTDEGFLSDEELAILKKELEIFPVNKKIAIVMHHHPIPVGTPLIDHYVLRNDKKFWNIVSGTKVELIICGHVHGDYQFKHKNIAIESSPAACLQFEKGTQDLKIDKKIGYKIYHFEQEGYKSITKMWESAEENDKF